LTPKPKEGTTIIRRCHSEKQRLIIFVVPALFFLGLVCCHDCFEPALLGWLVLQTKKQQQATNDE
jgi:hypothetical protein